MTASRPALTRRTALALGSGGALAAVLAACGQSQNRDASGSAAPTSASAGNLLKSIQSSKKVRIGVEGTFKPYAYHDDQGQLVGFEKEIADAIAAGLGATAQYVETEWDSLIAGLDVNKYDLVINNVGITDERKKKYLFSAPYARSIGRVAVPKDSPIQTLEELKGKNAAQSATSNYAAQMQALGATILPVQGFAEAIELVVQGRADATANDLVTFQTYLKDKPDANFRLLDPELPDETDSGVIMRKGQEPLQKKVDEVLATLKSDGTLKGIYEKWVGTDLTPQG